MRSRRTLEAAGLIGAAAAAVALAMGPAALAHHSFAMFDYKNQITLSGTVVSFQWTNPHAFIDLAVADQASQGATRRYTVECASPNVLTRLGWKFNTLKPGDKVTLLINPLKSGQAGGMLHEATLSDGRKLSDGNPPGGSFDR
jgi:hypothetical protein